MQGANSCCRRARVRKHQVRLTRGKVTRKDHVERSRPEMLHEQAMHAPFIQGARIQNQKVDIRGRAKPALSERADHLGNHSGCVKCGECGSHFRFDPRPQRAITFVEESVESGLWIATAKHGLFIDLSHPNPADFTEGSTKPVSRRPAQRRPPPGLQRIQTPGRVKSGTLIATGPACSLVCRQVNAYAPKLLGAQCQLPREADQPQMQGVRQAPRPEGHGYAGRIGG